MPPICTTHPARCTPHRAPLIILATVNARYSHAAFGLRWIWANLGALRDQTVIREFTLGQSAGEIAEALLGEEPRVLGLGVYIWNVTVLTQVVQVVKAVRPEVVVVLGGPEASHEYEGTALFESADYLIRGEGEVAFAELAGALLEAEKPGEKVIPAEALDLANLVLPYDAYTEEDLARRLIYVEASRGCPFRCEFCLSSLDLRVREFPLEPFLEAMSRLIERGVRQFKFVDRTFNLRPERVAAVLQFFRERWRDGMRLHFEIVPDRLSKETLGLIAEFPAGGLHLEAGVQTFDPEVLELISRKQDVARTEETLRFLRRETGALIHADLLVGLPGESCLSIAASFNRLMALEPHELQVGILKRLKGTAIARFSATHALAFSTHPPYEVLQTDRLRFEQMQRLKRFARYFDVYYNSGNFPRSLPLLWRTRPSAFTAFMDFSDAVWRTTGRTHELPLVEQVRQLHAFLVGARVDDTQTIANALREDFHRVPGRKDRLEFLSRPAL